MIFCPSSEITKSLKSLAAFGMRSFRADAQRLELGEDRILDDPIHRRPFAFDLFHIVQVSVEDKRKLASDQKISDHREPGIKLKLPGGQFFHVSQALLFPHPL